MKEPRLLQEQKAMLLLLETMPVEDKKLIKELSTEFINECVSLLQKYTDAVVAIIDEGSDGTD